MTIEQIERVVQRVTYVPGMVIRAMPALDGMVELALDGVVEDSEGGGQIRQQFRMMFDPAMFNDEFGVLFAVAGMIRQYAQHEVDEWFRYKGERVRAPHRAVAGK